MNKHMELEIITSTETAVKTTIKEIYIPAYYGEAGILENHLPYISLLNYGEISYRDTQGIDHYIFIEEGFIENSGNKITIVSDSIERGEEMDGSEIEASYDELNKKIQSAPKGEISPEELEDALLQQKKLKIKVDILKKLEKR